MDGMEVILINDGSADESGKLCDIYAKKYLQVKVIHQKNKGVLESRKKGVELSEGKYVTFVDSDDWIEEGMLGEFIRIVETAERVDLVVSGLICDKGGNLFRKSGGIPPGTYDVETDHIFDRMLYDWKNGEMGIPGYACGKLFCRDLLSESIRSVDKGIVHGEDYAWFYSYVPLAKK